MKETQAPARGTRGDAGRLFDELLVTLVQGGDRAAGELLVRRWHPRLLRTARRLVGSEMAPGAVQDTWISILRSIGSLRDPARFAPWAFGILHRRCADAIRRTQARRAIAMGEAEAPAQSAPDEALPLVQAFAALPAEQRLAAQLFFVEGLTLAEIAEVQHVPAGTAATRIYHARRKLKAALLGE